MLLAALVLGAIALYFFGVRAALWAAGATLCCASLALLAPELGDGDLRASSPPAPSRCGRSAPAGHGRPTRSSPFASSAAPRRRAWSTARSLLGGGDDDDRKKK